MWWASFCQLELDHLGYLKLEIIDEVAEKSPQQQLKVTRQ
jgi:hypothetical protein